MHECTHTPKKREFFDVMENIMWIGIHTIFPLLTQPCSLALNLAILLFRSYVRARIWPQNKLLAGWLIFWGSSNKHCHHLSSPQPGLPYSLSSSLHCSRSCHHNFSFESVLSGYIFYHYYPFFVCPQVCNVIHEVLLGCGWYIIVWWELVILVVGVYYWRSKGCLFSVLRW